MTRHSTISLIALLAVTTSASAGIPGESLRFDDAIMVQLRPAASLEGFVAAWNVDHPTALITPADSVPGRPVHLFDVDLPANYTPQFIDLLELSLETNYLSFIDVFVEPGAGGSEPEVMGEFLYTNETGEGQTGATYVDNIAPSRFETQFGAQQLALSNAHAMSTGVGTVIAVLDTGVDGAHPELAGSLLPFGWDFVDNDADPSETADGIDSDNDGAIDEMSGHGTFVSGIALLVAPDARILPVRVLDDDGIGHSWLFVRGLYYAIDLGVEVINASLGSTYASSILEQAVVEASMRGIPVIAAGGNLNRSTPRERPAMDQAIGVAALAPNGVKSPFSNYSRRLFISAPGSGSGPDDAVVGPVPGGTYATWEGTSFAAPFVSGTIALLRSQLQASPGNSSLHFLLTQQLAQSVDPIYAMNPQFLKDMELGWGRVNAGAATALNGSGPTRLGDLDADGVIGFNDLVELLGAWGATFHHADLDGDNIVGFLDLLILLGNWS